MVREAKAKGAHRMTTIQLLSLAMLGSKQIVGTSVFAPARAVLRYASVSQFTLSLQKCLLDAS